MALLVAAFSSMVGMIDIALPLQYNLVMLGKGSYDYNVVALYNYDKPGNVAGYITYAFAFHDGSPVALVDQSTNGVPDWTPTKNEDVASHFEDIADD